MDVIMDTQKPEINAAINALRLSFQTSIFKVEDLMNKRQFSANFLWREFIEGETNKLGSIAAVVEMFSSLGYTDFQIIEFFLTAGYSNPEIANALASAKWPLDRLGMALKLAKSDVVRHWNDNDVFSFVLSCQRDDAWVINTLFYSNCFHSRSLAYLIRLGWDQKRIFKAIIDADCINTDVYEVLLGPEDSDSDWNDGLILELLQELSISDSKVVEILMKFGKNVPNVIHILFCVNWSEDRIIAALGSNQISMIKVAVAMINHGFSKSRAIKMVEASGCNDEDILFGFYQEDWPNLMIVDCLLEAAWDIPRIIKAMINIGWTEFFISQMIDEGAENYEFKKNDYWDDNSVNEWRMVLNQALKDMGFVPNIF